jgi:Acetyltransferase (GNAT) domain
MTGTGYLHDRYVNSLAEFGTPRQLAACGGWILERPISGSDYRDAMGCYPLFLCENWAGLAEDMARLGQSLVSLALVTDPFGDYTMADLEQCFNGKIIPYKEHLVLDLQRPLQETTRKGHRKKARHALRELEVEAIENPITFLDEWTKLYSQLIQRHNLHGIHAFSRASFEQQLSVPGTVAVCARHEGQAVGAQIMYFQGDVVHCHLAAFTATGYEMDASYAIDLFSIEYCLNKARWYNLGGGAGINSKEDGLTWYKQGWTSDTRTTYFCGHIFDQVAYDEIVAARSSAPTAYFPAYRQGEFG